MSLDEEKCSFCSCGPMQHEALAKTANGRLICDTCWLYDICTSPKLSTAPSKNGPCEDADGRAIPTCPHRPKLEGNFENVPGFTWEKACTS